MNPKINELVARIKELQAEVEAELAARRAEFQFTLEDRKVRFERQILERQRQFKAGIYAYLRQAKLRNVVTAPVIYAMFIPLLLADASVTFYQYTCFPLYRIPRVRRRDFMRYDRNQLAYLNLIEKINCAYCAYGNGLAAYVREIVGLTEQYWCPIKHAQRVLDEHRHYQDFVEYGDAESYRKELAKLRRDIEV